MDELRGVFPYLPSPITSDGRVDGKGIRSLVDHLVAAKVHGLVPLGSTGEFAYLDDAQKADVIRNVIEATAGRVPVIAGVAATSTRSAVEQTRRAVSLGADGILAVMELYFPVSDAGVVAYFSAIAEEAGNLPVVLYTNPQFQSGDLSIPTIVKLAEVPNIRYLKDASSNTGRLLSIMNRTRGKLGIFSASAHIPACVMLLGGLGWMAGPACVAPRQSVRLHNLAIRGEWQTAMELQSRLWRLNEAFSKYSLAACIKAALTLQGFPMGNPVPPQTPLGPEALADIASVLKEIDAA